MRNRKRTWMKAGVLASALFLSDRTALAATYNWCPTASSGAIVCTNCTVNLTCDISGFGILIKGNYVTLDGNGHAISSYDPGNSVPAIRDHGTGNTIRNVYVYYPYDGIEVRQQGSALGAKIVSNVGVYGSLGYGVNVKNDGSQPSLYPQTAYVRDSWVFGSGTGFYHSGSNMQATVGGTLGLFDRLMGNWNSYGFEGWYTKTEIRNSDFSGNRQRGVDISNNLWGQFHSNTADNNRWGVSLFNNANFGMSGNSGHGNTEIDCYSSSGAQWGVQNVFGTAFGTGCINTN